MNYTPEKLVAISRYQKYFPTLPTQILTSIALYETLQKHEKSEEEAYKAVSEEMWKFLDPSGMQKHAKKRFFLPLMKKIVPFGFIKGSGTGWQRTESV